jgi:predicted ABC-type ATPase
MILAGVDGAGKSSVISRALTQRGLSWFNPDDFARELLQQGGYTRQAANAEAWVAGRNLLRGAIFGGHDHAHETTLGGNSIPRMIAGAADTHDVHLWYCGLATPELHIARVQARVEAGGHAIDSARIRKRWLTAPGNLVDLMPKLVSLRVYDNSAIAAPGEPIPVPELLIDVRDQVVRQPLADDLEALVALPAWVHAIAEAALSNDPRWSDAPGSNAVRGSAPRSSPRR